MSIIQTGPARNVNIVVNINEAFVDHTLFMAVEYAYGMDVQGDVLELGTMTGSTALALVLGIKVSDGTQSMHKDLYLLDSFQGLPKARMPQDSESPHFMNGSWREGDCIDLSEAALRKKMDEELPGRVHVIGGWFKDTVPSLTNAFSCIHVDCDLYESTMDALTPLFEKGLVSPGAIILFDDWNNNRADPRYGERAAWADLVVRFAIHSSDEGGYGIAGHKFIVHGYIA